MQENGAPRWSSEVEYQMANKPVSDNPLGAIREQSSASNKNGCHIRIPLRSEQVEGKESDEGSVSTDPRTATQDPDCTLKY